MKLFVLFLLGYCLAEEVSYEQFKVFRAYPRSKKDIDSLKQYVDNRPHFDFWKPPSHIGSNVDIMVPPLYKTKFQNYLTLNGINSEIFIENVQELINNERKVSGIKKTGFDWKQYHTLDEVSLFLYDIILYIILKNFFYFRYIHGCIV